MSLYQIAFLFLAAAVAGVLNAVAGGGSFISFPALLLAGIPPVSANATNTVALWPGSAASIGAYRRELKSQRGHILFFGIVSLAGGLLGSILLLHTKDAEFKRLIPYLMLIATVTFAASPAVSRAVRRVSASGSAGGPARQAGLIALYLVIAVYGGFFGAGVSILILAVFSLLGFENIHEMNALKTLQAVLINGVAVVIFVSAGIIRWPQAMAMTAGAIAGGYGGAAIARRLPALWVRSGVIVVGCVLTAYFFVK